MNDVPPSIFTTSIWLTIVKILTHLCILISLRLSQAVTVCQRMVESRPSPYWPATLQPWIRPSNLRRSKDTSLVNELR